MIGQTVLNNEMAISPIINKLKQVIPIIWLFIGLQTSVYADGKLDLTKLKPGKNKIELGWTDMPQCSKLENEEAKGSVLVCHDGGQNCGWWGCIPNAPSCRTEVRNLGFQVPVPYIADQKGFAYAEIDLPQVPSTIDDLKDDVNTIINDNIKNALRNHIDSGVNNFSNDVKVCAVTASAGSIVSAIVSGGSAALPAFMGVLNPCLETSFNRFSSNIYNVPEVINGAIRNTSDDLKKYFSDMGKGGVKVYATSTCSNWRRL